jgi:subtilisin family serine protease
MKSDRLPTAYRVSSPLVASVVGLMCAMAGFASAQTPTPNPAPTTREEQNSFGVYRINAPSIYKLGVIGSNVTAAIIDTGLLVTHPEFSNRVLQGYNAFTGDSNVTDGNGHGTHVAGIIGAALNNVNSGMFGVAYGVSLLPVKVLNDRGSGTSASVAAGINWAVKQQPFVMNMSLGASSPSTSIENELRVAVSSGILIIAAAGNSGGAAPNWPARYANQDWGKGKEDLGKGRIIAVGAVDAQNNIASWSNRAGDTADSYLVAPGTNIYSTYSKQDKKTKEYLATYATLSGTSMATPYVTGAAALIKSGWSYLTAQQVAGILLDSATYLGDPAIYGRGMLNLDAALEPVGDLGITTTSGGRYHPLRLASISTSAVTGVALQAAARAGQLQMAGFDRYGRDFQVDLAPAVRRTASTTNGLAGMLSAVDSAATERRLYNGATYTVAYRSEATRLAFGDQSGYAAGKDGYAMSLTDASGRELVFGLSGMGANAFGLAGELTRAGDTAPAQLAHPYFPLAERHMHAGIGLPLGDGLRVKVGVLASDPRIMTSEGVPLINDRRRSMALGELSGTFRSAIWTVGLGHLQESDSVLGTVQTGALGYSGNTGTTIANLGFAWSPVARVKLGAQYTAGFTSGASNRSDTLVTGYTSSRSDAYAVFASLTDAFAKGDCLSFTVSQPMRSASGAMQLVVPVGADEQGAPVMQNRSIALRPDGREIRSDVLYLSPLNRHASTFVGVALRNQPDHDRTAPRQVTVGAGIKAVF